MMILQEEETTMSYNRYSKKQKEKLRKELNRK